MIYLRNPRNFPDFDYKFAEDWLKALDIGNYSQTTKCLRDNKGFCCLGVAREIQQSNVWYYGEGSYYYLYGNLRFVQDLDGKTRERLGLTLDNMEELMSMNDSRFTFPQIAEWLKGNIYLIKED